MVGRSFDGALIRRFTVVMEALHETLHIRMHENIARSRISFRMAEKVFLRAENSSKQTHTNAHFPFNLSEYIYILYLYFTIAFILPLQIQISFKEIWN